ncbi:hypothetical protein AB6M97_06360 [Streptococcus hillyeri]|uniref:hypothetical protein n=1 Tax=Streptococcus hillyeri TaxID=2282420 RepID=UPI0034E2D54D
MQEPKDNFKSDPKPKITSLHSKNARKPDKTIHDIIELENNKEESIMSQDTYTKSEIDLKFQNLETKIEGKFDQLSQKIDFSVQHILSETKNMLLEQQVKEKTERENERKTTNRWLIGIAISLAGLIVSVIVNFFLRK